MNDITEIQARRVLEVVDAGLVSGLGRPELGQMCVEAAVCFALGMPHGDEPSCVAPTLRRLKIRLNDSRWSSNRSRTDGLRCLALAQLGSAGVLDEKEFVRRVVDYAIRVSTPKALRIAVSLQKHATHRTALLDAANKCEVEGTRDSAGEANKGAAAAAASYAAAAASYAADASSYAADASYAAAADAARDKSLVEYAEAIVQILINMGAPGCQWLYLTEAA